MKDGKKLLITVIEYKLDKLDNIDESISTYNNNNLINFYCDLLISYDALADCDKSVLEYIFNYEKKANNTTFQLLLEARDLLIGKKNYNLQVELDTKYLEAIKKFIQSLEKYLDKYQLPKENITINKERLITILDNISNNTIITDFEVIKSAIKDYSEATYDNLLTIIFDFINHHNMHIMNGDIYETNSSVQNKRKIKLNKTIKDILKKLEITEDEIPEFILDDINNIDRNELFEIFTIAKRNKAEDYGILHLFDKNNILDKLVLIMYSNPRNIKRVVDATKDINGTVNINLLKIICNNLVSCFIDENPYFQSNHNNFLKNIKMLKELGVNYRSLIVKNPVFMLTKNEAITYTLNVMEENNLNKKMLINKCYKILSLKPTLLIDNIKVLKKYDIDGQWIEENDGYNLLKCSNLDFILTKIKLTTNKEIKDNSIDLINKMIIKSIIS